MRREKADHPGRTRISGAGTGALLLLPLMVLLLAASARAQDNAAVSATRYIDEALSNNPSLEAMRERIRMKENAAVRAGALDDPKLRVGITNVPIRSWDFREEDMTGKEIGFSQMLPFPGKRAHLVEMGLRDKEQAEHDLEEMRNMLRAEIKMTCAELAAVRQQAELVRRTREILRDVVAVTRETYAVGRAGQADVLRGQVETGKMREMLIALENRERVLSVRLNTLAARSPVETVPPLVGQGEFALAYSEGNLMTIYERDRPARKALQARIRKGDIGVVHARHEGRPDFEVSFSYMQREDMPDGTKRADMFSSMVMMTLPIWKKEKVEPGIREMEAEKGMAVRELASLDLEASNLIGRSLATLESRLEAAVLYRTTLIPNAEQSFQATSESYRVGKVDFPMLMDTVMAVLSFRREYAAMVGDLHMEKARLEAAVGRELE